ncbi:MAG: hypothetical protein Q8P18_29600 [Pseudomonadota bacterium]|nr:hypothetical protein [Pseudomonadota bacterium]
MILANAEFVAMGGAGAAFAVGGAGMMLSPAAPANRRMESVAPIVWSLVLLQSQIGEKQDMSNLGAALDEDVRMFNIGLSGGYHNGAGGILGAGADYQVGDARVAVVEGHASAAVALLGGDLVLGAGPRLLGMRVTADGVHHDYFGAGVELGAVFANWRQAWNFALTLRSGVAAGPVDGAYDGIDAARLPPEIIAGIGWSNLANLPEETGGIPVRLVADVAVDAPVPGAVALQTVFQGELIPRGGWYTVSPRLGAEVDVWRNRFRLRAGTYLEPSRTDLAGPRPHATGGFELRLFHVAAFKERVKLDLAWQIGVDYAPGYFHGAWVGINVWQQGQVGGQYDRDVAPDVTAP